MARCTSPKAQPAGSRALIPKTGASHDVRQRSAAVDPASVIGGAIDVAFIGKTAYALVTLRRP